MFGVFVCVCVCGRWMYVPVCVCVCAWIALSLPYSNYSAPLTVPSDLHSFFVLKFLLSAFLSSFSARCSTGLRVSPTVVCTFVTTHITAGPCLCLVRGFQFPYITLRNPVLFDFGLHNCTSLNLWIKELVDRAGRKLCIILCRSLLRSRRCLS